MRNIQELITELKERAKHSSDADAEFFTEVADALGSRNDVIATFAAAKDMHDNNPLVKRYIQSWRARTGYNDLTYPSGDQVYRDYFSLYNEVKRIERCDGCLRWDREEKQCGIGPGHCYINTCIVPETCQWVWRGPAHLVTARDAIKKKGE